VQEERDAVHVVRLRDGRGRPAGGSVEQHGAAVLRAAGVHRSGHGGRRVRVDGGRQTLPTPHRRPPLAGHRILRGAVRRRGRATGGRRPGGVRVHAGRRPGDRVRGHPRQLEVLRHPGRFRAVGRVPSRHAARVRHAVRSPQRARLLRHVLRCLPAPGVRLPADRPVEAGRHRRPSVRVVRYVITISLIYYHNIIILYRVEDF